MIPLQRHYRSALGLICAAAWLFSCVSAPTPPAQSAGADARRTAPGGGRCARNDIFGPAQVSADVYAARTGATARLFSELEPSTKEKPLEECGLRTVLKKLLALRCADGSNPFEGNMNQAHASRAGNFGPGGRCDSIIDRYDVKCPERTYEVFADGYVCPPSLGGD